MRTVPASLLWPRPRLCASRPIRHMPCRTPFDDDERVVHLPRGALALSWGIRMELRLAGVTGENASASPAISYNGNEATLCMP